MKECLECGKVFEDQADACPQHGRTLEQPLPGPLLIDGKYLIERALARGGMGAVYLARHINLQKAFALKVIKPDRQREEFLARFQLEAKALGRLDHPGIVRVTDYGVDAARGGIPYLVMEHLRGAPLSQTILQGPTPWSKARPILEGIASALDFAHRQGIVHRDLKPANIFVVPREDGSPAVRILDFGLVRFMDGATAVGANDPTQPVGRLTQLLQLDRESSDRRSAATVDLTMEASATTDAFPLREDQALTMDGSFLGTPQYVSPETIQGRGGPASDLYAFGLIAAELLTGRPTFDGSPVQLIHKHLFEEPPPPSRFNPALPEEVDRILLELLRKEPERRPTGAADVVQALDDAFGKQEETFERRRERPRLVRWSAALALFALSVTLLGSRFPLFAKFDNSMADLAAGYRPAATLDSRLLLTLVPEEFWTQEGLTDIDSFAQTLTQVLNARARGICVDLILPERCGRSPAFHRLVLEHPDRLVFSMISLEGKVRGAEWAGAIGAVLGPQAVDSLFSFVNTREDDDGVVRHYPLSYRDTRGRRRSSLALNTVSRLFNLPPPAGDGPPLHLDFSLTWQGNMMEWGDLPLSLKRNPEHFRGKVLLIGGKSEFSEDMFRVPHLRSQPELAPGLAIHATAMEALLSDRHIREAGPEWSGPLVFLLIGPLGLIILRRGSAGRALALLAGLTVAYLAATFCLFVYAGVAFPVGAPTAALILGMPAALWIRSRVSSAAPQEARKEGRSQESEVRSREKEQ